MSNFAHRDNVWGLMPAAITVFRVGTVALASDHLRVNRSTIERKLKQLDALLGESVFERQRGRFVATSFGRDLFAAFETAQAELEPFTHRAEAVDTNTPRPLHISVAPHMVHLIGPVLFALRDEMPDLQFRIISTYDLTDLSAGDADIAIRVSQGQPEPPLVGRRLVRLEGAMYRAVEQDGEPKAFVGRSEERDIPPYATEHSKTLDYVAADDVEVQKAMIAAGCLGRMPCFCVDTDPRFVRIGPILPNIGWWVWLVCHHARARSPIIRTAMDHLDAILKARPEFEVKQSS
jgi:DNA-binding transcriptional LysR family regulator